VIEGLLGRKLGMIQVFDKEGRLRGATVIEAGPCLVTQLRTEEKDGYRAVQIGFGSARHVNKPMRGHLQRQGDLRYLREFRTDDPSQHSVGDRIGAEMFQEGDQVDITGISKGRGFAGVVKRHGFHGGPKTHGQSDRHRAPGSIGSGNTPGRVFKGMRMAGHMGAEKVTVRNLEVIESNAARGMLLIAGAVPGARNGLLKIRYAKKTLEEARTRKPQPAEREVAPSPDQEEAPPSAEEQETPKAKVEEPAPEDTESEAEQPEEANGDETESSSDEEEPS
jgi:large subunit ribosomal protein L3